MRNGGQGSFARTATIRLRVTVTPFSTYDGIAGWLGDTRKVWVRAPAERGQANVAVRRLIAGATSRLKSIDVSGLETAEVHRQLSRNGCNS